MAHVLSYGNLPEAPDAYATWQAETLEKIRVLQDSSPEVAIPQLGYLIEKYSIGMNIERNERPVYRAAQSALLAIPGHATYYQDKIESLRAEVLDNSRKSGEELSKMQDEGREPVTLWAYEEYYAAVAFPILGQLPSAETVKVLGGFLNDPEGRDGKNLLGEPRSKTGDDFFPRPCHAEIATRSIRKLGIDHPPFAAPKGNEREILREGEIDAWKDWWNEVKAGKRTYHFVGSTIEYGADGPVSPTAIRNPARDPKRLDGLAPGDKGSGSRGGQSMSESARGPGAFVMIAIVVVCAACLAAIGYFLRMRSRRT